MGDKYQNVYRRNRAKPANHESDVTCFHGNVSIRPGWVGVTLRRRGGTLTLTRNVEFVAASESDPAT